MIFIIICFFVHWTKVISAAKGLKDKHMPWVQEGLDSQLGHNKPLESMAYPFIMVKDKHLLEKQEGLDSQQGSN